ncbi:hypothetical protein BH11ARM2_BH11ARM2_01260 [soil metagenome]
MRDEFLKDHIPDMRRFPERKMVLLIDFDGKNKNYESVLLAIPEDLLPRVIILGVATEPEDLKRRLRREPELFPGLNNLEAIGQRLAEDCGKQTGSLWSHTLFSHEAAHKELTRLGEAFAHTAFDSN